MFAAQFAHADLVALLLEKGANPSQKDSFYGVTVMTAFQMSGGAPNLATPRKTSRTTP